MKKSKTKISIIGLGNFGTLAASILGKHFEVLIHHYRKRDGDEEKAEIIGARLVDLKEAAECDIVILTTPISKTKEVIKKIVPLMKKGSLLLDTCSVKVFPCRWLKKYANNNIEIMGTHPMFGPTTSKFDFKKQVWNLNGLQIVLCPLKISEERYLNIKKFMVSLGLTVIKTTPEDHDKQNAKTLSFVHYTGRSLLRAGIGEQEIFTPGYRDLLSILPHTTSDNWQLFYDMNNYNPYSDEVRENFRRASFEIEEKIINSRDENALERSREMIDLIDKRIFELIEKRLEYSKKIGDYKKEKGLKIVDKEREKKIINEKAGKFVFDKKFIEKFYRLIFNESYKRQ